MSLKAVFECSAFLLVACGAHNGELKRANTAGAAALDCPVTDSQATLLRDGEQYRAYARELIADLADKRQKLEALTTQPFTRL